VLFELRSQHGQISQANEANASCQGVCWRVE
jgi:hypothetical protein